MSKEILRERESETERERKKFALFEKNFHFFKLPFFTMDNNILKNTQQSVWKNCIIYVQKICFGYFIKIALQLILIRNLLKFRVF